MNNVIEFSRNSINSMLQDMKEQELESCVVVGVAADGSCVVGYNTAEALEALGILELGKMYVMEDLYETN